MAALRVAARRLVGGGQTPAVAVEATQRRLIPRFFQAGRAKSTTSSAAAAADANLAAGKGCEDRGKLLTEIHNMREELYHKVSYAARTYNILGKEGKNISRLREELAAQVEYRPGDNTWREELYDMVSHAERIYKIHGKAGKEISRLREELATQVEPRPGDISWRILRGNSKLDSYVGFASFIFTSYVLMGMATGLIVELEPDERRWIKKKREQARKLKEEQK